MEAQTSSTVAAVPAPSAEMARMAWRCGLGKTQRPGDDALKINVQISMDMINIHGYYGYAGQARLEPGLQPVSFNVCHKVHACSLGADMQLSSSDMPMLLVTAHSSCSLHMPGCGHPGGCVHGWAREALALVQSLRHDCVAHARLCAPWRLCAGWA